jgi:lipoic acid synthetase
VHPDEFVAWKQRGEARGIRHVESGPLVRSSYHAEKQVAAHATAM